MSWSAISILFLNSTTSLGSLFQRLTTLSVKKFFLPNLRLAGVSCFTSLGLHIQRNRESTVEFDELSPLKAHSLLWLLQQYIILMQFSKESDPSHSHYLLSSSTHRFGIWIPSWGCHFFQKALSHQYTHCSRRNTVRAALRQFIPTHLLLLFFPVWEKPVVPKNTHTCINNKRSPGNFVIGITLLLSCFKATEAFQTQLMQ